MVDLLSAPEEESWPSGEETWRLYIGPNTLREEIVYQLLSRGSASVAVSSGVIMEVELSE